MDTGILLMEAMCACIRGRQVEWVQIPEEAQWQKLIALAREQQALPMVVEAAYGCPAFQSRPEEWKRGLKQAGMQASISQTMRTAAFLLLFREMEQAGLHPVVMKGITCRMLYPKPDCRISADEDLLVPEEEFALMAEFLLQQGFACRDGKPDMEQAFELGFVRKDGLYLEVHRTPFAPGSDALGQLNEFFGASVERSCPVSACGGQVMGMDPHDHMLYLLLHAYKHLIHSGFGVRQVCDIVLWAETYGAQIDWKLMRSQCQQARAWKFAQGVFEIGVHYLEFDLERAGIPGDLLEGEVPFEELLEDLLESGVFGGKDLSRKHSSTITLRTVESDRKGDSYSLGKTLFPSREAMEGRYPYLEKYPLLLPVAWGQRILQYGKELHQSESGNDAAESLRIGKHRTQLLKKLDIID